MRLCCALVIAVLVGCSDDGGTGPDGPVADLAGADHPVALDAGGPDLAVQDGSPDGSPADSASLEVLSIEWPCASEGKIYPSKAQNEQGFLIAARLAPATYPFTVTAVRYQLESSDVCDNTLAHRVEVTHGAFSAPENTPSSVQTINVPAASTAPQQRMVEQQLAQPIQLGAGEQLFVAVEMPEGPDGKLVCLTACMGNGVPDHTFWSNATQAPYSWTALNGVSLNVAIMALGHP